MFGSSIGSGEILLILVVALLLFGAQRIPSIARSLGRALAEFRRASNDLSRDILDDNPPPSPPLPPAISCSSIRAPHESPEHDKQG
jgi:TatA/E family protein of Tat protein translocase